MKNRIVWFPCALAWISVATGADLPPVKAGNDHGAPPFLLKDGWKPLLEGKSFDGWTCHSPQHAGWISIWPLRPLSG